METLKPAMSRGRFLSGGFVNTSDPQLRGMEAHYLYRTR